MKEAPSTGSGGGLWTVPMSRGMVRTNGPRAVSPGGGGPQAGDLRPPPKQPAPHRARAPTALRRESGDRPAGARNARAERAGEPRATSRHEREPAEDRALALAALLD